MNIEQKALLRKGVEWVEEQDALPFEQRSWHQACWWISPEHHAVMTGLKAKDCGSAYCLFGYLANITGQEWDAATAGMLGARLKSGRTVESYVRDLLDLDDQEAEELSRAGNSAADIREVAERLAGERL